MHCDGCKEFTLLVRCPRTHAFKRLSDRTGESRALQRRDQVLLSVLFVATIAYTAIAPNFDQPFVSYAFASAIIFLCVTPGTKTAHWILAFMAGGVSAVCYLGFPLDVGQRTLFAPCAGAVGRGCLLVLGWRAIWTTGEQRRALQKVWALSIGLVLFVFASLIALNITVWVHRPLLDYYLYVFDGSLGFQPSFLVGQIFGRYKEVSAAEHVIYNGLPLAIALLCAAHLKSKAPWRPLLIIATAGVFGYLVYFAFPAAGPIHVSGAAFPNSPHAFGALSRLRPHPLYAVGGPRNAMPSLHVAWVLLIWFNCRPFSPRMRLLALMYVLLTMVATLGMGEHYLADLVVALPFAVGVQALWPPARYKIFALAEGLTVVWLLALRYATHFFLLSPLIPWGFTLASTAISLDLYRHLIFWVEPLQPTDG